MLRSNMRAGAVSNTVTESMQISGHFNLIYLKAPYNCIIYNH